jgi:hypothetical protein
MNCWRCGAGIEVAERVGFRESCPQCDRPLHVCRNCGFHDPGYHNQCRETMAELVADKERGNFCEYFKPRTAAQAAKPSGDSAPRRSPTAARATLEELFKRK